jgi:hypothetical protein
MTKKTKKMESKKKKNRKKKNKMKRRITTWQSRRMIKTKNTT